MSVNIKKFNNKNNKITLKLSYKAVSDFYNIYGSLPEILIS